MKFTCENCGAQYLIADAKLGERGVKVRCKKCSYVIILRPSGWSPDQKRDVREEASPPSADIDPPIAAREAREKDAIADEIAAGPDLGLSQEFAAMGFSESNGDLDSSPFAGRYAGGSLERLPSFNIGPSSDPIVADRPNSDETEVLGRRPNLGSSMPEIDDDRVGDPTHVERVAMSEEEDTPLEMDGGTGELNAALAKVQRNELLEMRSHLESDLEGLSSALDPRGVKKQKAPIEAPAPAKPENHRPNFQALNALASENESPSDPSYNIADEARAEAEIGSAFEAMFDVPTDDGFKNRPDKLPTRVFDTEAMEKVEQEQVLARPAGYVEQVSEWYVAIDDQQVGPMTVDEVKERWEAGELAADSLCWKQGLGDWQPIKMSPELRSSLGSMEDRERTVVANLQEEDSVPGGPVPPQISMHPDPPEREHSMGASSVGDVGMDEPSWRPSAASALASLAAEELASAQSSAGLPTIKVQDIAVGAALPATSDALEKLLAAGAGTAAASQFGAAEKSESSVRPLPRRAEAITSMPLRDPTSDRSRTSLMLPLSILGAAVVLVGGIAWVMSGKDQPGVAAMPSQPTQPVAMVNGNPPPPAAETPPPPAEVAKAVEPPATEVKTEVKQPENAAAVAKTEEKEPEQSEEESEDEPGKKKKKNGNGTKKKTEKTPRPPREKREIVNDPPPPSRRERESGEVEIDDLLGPSKGKRPSERTPIDEEDVPKQLDDSDILNVLRKNRKAIIDCVKKQAAADASVSGTMNVNMVITKNGQTTRITVSPDRYSKTVAGKCVMNAVKSWKFPKFSGPNMPIDFPVRIR